MIPDWIKVVIGSLLGSVLSTIGALLVTSAQQRASLRSVVVQKKAQIAADVLFATLRYLDALKAAATLAQTSETPDGATKSQAAFHEVRVRWAEVQPSEEEFFKAWTLAEAHLPDDVHGLMENASTIGRHLRASQEMHAVMVGQGGYPPAFADAFGSKPKALIDELRLKVKTRLRQLAQL